MQERLAGQFLSDLRCLDLRKWWIKMARIVAGVGVPHTPMFPATVRVGDPENETARMYQRVKEQLDEVRTSFSIIIPLSAWELQNRRRARTTIRPG
jgi:hypothetical protein